MKIIMYLTFLVAIALPSVSYSVVLNPLEVSNRAQCAADSTTPTRSSFLLVNSYNAGRLGYGMAKSANLNSEEITQRSLYEFRMSVAKLQKLILAKLVSGQLPLLPVELGKSNLKYAQIAQKCDSEVFCPELSQYLSRVWRASVEKEEHKKIEMLKAVDNFTGNDFIREQIETQCYYLRKFSPLQSHLFGTDIARKGLSDIGKALSNTEEYITECDDPDFALESRHAAVQIEIHADPKSWSKYGFNFWNSLKIYTSWAWRNVPEIKNYAPRFNSVFRNLDLEEGLLYISNGCRSLTPPQCDSQNLSLNSLRELAKVQVQTDEFDKHIAAGPEKELLKKGARSINDNFLGLLNHETASAWVANFSENFKEKQFIFKNKLMHAHQFFSLMASKVNPEQVPKDLLQLSKQSLESDVIKTQLYYLCAEWNLSSNKDFDFLHTDILSIGQINEMLKQSTSIGAEIQEQIGYYNNLARGIGESCMQLEEDGYFDFNEETLPTPAGYQDWAKEMLNPIHVQTQREPSLETKIFTKSPYLVAGSNSDVVVCNSAIDCSREVLRHAVNLLNVSKFASGFLSSGKIQSSEMLNPYNELAACKVYDPWFTKKRVRKRFVADLVNTALVGATGIPIYLDVDFVPNKVTSLVSMIEDGEVKFDPTIQRSYMVTSLLADLGPLAGAPCAVQISPNAEKAFNFYAFGGVSLNLCQIRSKRQIDYKTAKDAHINKPTDRSFCAGCVLNFVGVSSAVSNTAQSVGEVNPLKLGVYLFRSIYRFFKGMKDPVNIPRSYTLDLDLVKQTYERYGDIPSSCVEDIKKSKSCKIDYCKAKASLWLEANANKEVKNINLKKSKNSYLAQFNDRKCGLRYDLEFSCNEKEKSSQLIQIKRTRVSKRTCSAEAGVL